MGSTLIDAFEESAFPHDHIPGHVFERQIHSLTDRWIGPHDMNPERLCNRDGRYEEVSQLNRPGTSGLAVAEGVRYADASRHVDEAQETISVCISPSVVQRLWFAIHPHFK